jgi:5-methylcytosine-specific restriction endonuclease McrA
VYSTSATAVKPNNQFNSVNKRLALPAAVRKALLHGNASCAYLDVKGKRCGSQRFLQIDHIHSWSRGGTNHPENLQVLCGVHNRLKFQIEESEK